jgi:hypothetical protein
VEKEIVDSGHRLNHHGYRKGVQDPEQHCFAHCTILLQHEDGGEKAEIGMTTKREEEDDKPREAREVICGKRSRDRAKVCVFRRTGAKKNYRPRALRAPGIARALIRLTSERVPTSPASSPISWWMESGTGALRRYDCNTLLCIKT